MTNYHFNFNQDNPSGNGLEMVSGDTLTIDAGFKLSSSYVTVQGVLSNGAHSVGGNNTLDISGTLQGTCDGFYSMAGNNVFHVYSGGLVLCGEGTGFNVHGGGNTLINSGTIDSTNSTVGNGVVFTGSNNTITNTSTGAISGAAGGLGVVLIGATNTLTNDGQIKDCVTAVVAFAGGNTVINTNLIAGDLYGLALGPGPNSVTNSVTGTISGSLCALSSEGDTNTIYNRGSIAVSTGGFGIPAMRISDNSHYCGSNLIVNYVSGDITGANDPGLRIGDGFNTIRNNGTIECGGGFDALSIGSNFSGGHNTIVNTGTIQTGGGANGFAMQIGGTNNTLTNSGTITSTNTNGGGIYMGGNATITNNAAGDISGPSGLNIAITLGGGNNTVTNNGHITDFVLLGTNTQSDSFLGAGGTFNGAIVGGKGDDTILVGTGDNHVLGGKGADFCQAGLGHTIFTYNNVNESFGNGGYGANMDTVDAYRTAGPPTYDTFEFTSQSGSKPFLSHIAWDGKIGGSVSTITFGADVQAAIGGTLSADGALLLTPDSGDLAGHVFLIVDGNGTPGYQTGADYIVELTNLSSPKHIEQHLLWIH